MNTHVKRAIIDHALALPAQEVCGFIYQVDHEVRAYPCENVTVEPKAEAFEIDPTEYVEVQKLGRVCGLYHGGMTHANEGFSEEDLAVAQEMCLPSYVYCGPSDKWARYIPPTYHVNPVGRDWAWGEADCYSTVEVHYRQKRGVYMTDYDRDESFERATESAITQHIADEGFGYVDKHAPILTDDVLLFRTPGCAYPHHLGVVVGPNMLLHHPRNNLSRVDALNGAWLRRLMGVLRHTGKATS